MAEIETLRKQLDKSISRSGFTLSSQMQPDASAYPPRWRPPQPSPPDSHDMRALLDALSEKAPRVPGRIYQDNREHPYQSESDARMDRDIRALLDGLSDSLASLDLPSVRAYDTPSSRRIAERYSDDSRGEGRNFRALLDRIAQTERDFMTDRYYSTTGPSSDAPNSWNTPGPDPILQSSIRQPGSLFTSPESQNNIGARFGTDLA